MSSAYDAALQFAIFARFNIIANDTATDVIKALDGDIVHDDTVGQPDFFMDLAVRTDDTVLDGGLFSNKSAFAHEAFETDLSFGQQCGIGMNVGVYFGAILVVAQGWQ